MSDQTKTIPEHIAIIMDGNGRWAKKRGLPRTAGHLAGAKNITRVIAAASQAGVKYMTIYAFSTENWKRPESEIDYLMKLIPQFCHQQLPKLMDNNIRLRIIGRLQDLPDFAREAIQEVIHQTAVNDGFTLNVAISYGGRAEITDAVNAILNDPNRPRTPLTEQDFARYLYAPDIPDPDLMIRTSGELRISNFMLWELSYSELYVTDTFWPDFDEIELQKALDAYANRNRRFGEVK